MAKNDNHHVYMPVSRMFIPTPARGALDSQKGTWFQNSSLDFLTFSKHSSSNSRNQGG